MRKNKPTMALLSVLIIGCGKVQNQNNRNRFAGERQNGGKIGDRVLWLLLVP